MALAAATTFFRAALQDAEGGWNDTPSHTPGLLGATSGWRSILLLVFIPLVAFAALLLVLGKRRNRLR